MELGREIPDYGDTFTMDEFIECCESHSFVDYDGYGYYSDGKLMYGLVRPSDVIKGKINKSYSHVVWFNK